MHATVTAALARLAKLVRRGRFWILLFWTVIAIVLVPEARTAAHRLESSVRVEGSLAASVDSELAARFHFPFVHRVLLVASGLPDPAEPEGGRALREIVSAVAAVPGVQETLSYLDSPDPVFRGRAGGTFLIVGLDPGDRPVESLMPPLRHATEALQARLRHRYATASLGWTGEVPLQMDVRQASADEARVAETRALPVALLLLVVAFGSIVAALLPIVVGVLAVLLTLGASALLARTWHLSIFVQNIASMIGLGLGIDYALLMVSQFRESLTRTESGGTAAEDSLPKAGRTLLLSGLPVGIGFAALLSVPASDFRSIGAAGILVTFCSLVLALTLLPAALAVLGRHIDAGRLIGRGGARRGETGARRWHRWGGLGVGRPWTALALGGTPL